MIPVLIVLMSVPFGSTDVGAWICAVVFLLIALTDTLDGYLARSRNQVTTFGKFMDPIADKLMVVAVMIVLVQLGSLPAFIPAIVAAREFLVSGLRMVLASGGVVVAASYIGKAKTVVTMAAITCFMIKDTAAVAPLQPAANVLSWTLMWTAVVLTIASMVDYFRSSVHVLFEKPAPQSPNSSLSVQHPAEPVSELPADPSVKLSGRVQSEPSDTLPTSALTTTSAALHDAATRVIKRAGELGVRLGTAESLTGGMISTTLTSVPGSSEVVAGGVVSYMVDVKQAVLGVDPDVIATSGVVSEQTAIQMARGALRVLKADISIAVTGVAGPGGGTQQTPVGTVCLALGVHNDAVVAETQHFEGDREQVRAATVGRALELLDYGISEYAKLQ